MLCHDPRISNVRWEMQETRNVALILAHISTKSGEAVDWNDVALAADDQDWSSHSNSPKQSGLDDQRQRTGELRALITRFDEICAAKKQ